MVNDLISIAELIGYIVVMLIVSAAVTALVVKIAPSESAKAARAARREAQQG